MNWRMLASLGMLLMLGMQILAQNGLPSQQRCLTDELHWNLKRQFPNGVPGRNMPSEAKTEELAEDFSYVIPVVVHVMHYNAFEQNVNLAQAQSQIEVLNEDYNRYGNGYNDDVVGSSANIRFCLATVDPDGNPTTGITYHQTGYAINLDPYTEDTLMKQIVQWDPNRYLNIWTVRKIYNGQIEGYAYFPEEVAGTIWDGFVVQATSFGRSGGIANTLGRTATHEVGHYLGLQHPWGNIELGCFVQDDGCDDTPPVDGAYFAQMPLCNAPAACDGQPRQVGNYMDYSADGCMNLFTQCQTGIMRNRLIKYRANLCSKETLLSTGCGSELDSIPLIGGVFLYPNPADRYLVLNVDMEDAGDTDIVIWDQMGREVMSKSAAIQGRGIYNLDLNEFTSGTYIIRISNAKTTKTDRFFVGR